MHSITARAIDLWQQVPSAKLGHMPYSYSIRSQLYDEYPTEPRARVGNFCQAAVRIIKQRRGNALTGAQKQSNRRAEFDQIAQAAGWKSWQDYSAAVKRGEVSIRARRGHGVD